MNKTLITLMAVAVTLGGCGATPKPRRLVIAIDVSDPARLLAYAKVAYELESSLKSSDRLTVYVFAHDCDLVYDGPPVRGRNEFNKRVGGELTQIRPALKVQGTRTDLAIECLASEAKASKVPIALALETDGGIEDLGSPVRHRLSNSVLAIRGSKEFREFVAIGIEPQWRRQWDGWLAPLGEQATTCGLNDDEAALRVVRKGDLR